MTRRAMTPDPKALEAAGTQLRHACGRIEQIFAQRETPPPEEWAAMYAKEVLPILEAALDAADLVERSAVVSFCDAILHGDPEHRGWLKEAAENFAVGEPVPPPRGSGLAAAQYQRVPEGWRLVHIAAHERAMDYREAAESGIGLARVELQRGDAKAALAHLDFYCKKMEIADEAMLAAAPKAGEGPEGE